MTCNWPFLNVSGLAFCAMVLPTVESHISHIWVIAVSWGGLYFDNAFDTMSPICVRWLVAAFLSMFNAH